ncbi:hypothetical protein DY000_02038123 [Brassica cretica]|uniref:Uncharacterized protein n=1 Tax=Brassica cretica TaxID=69181 RepID=A0ABQ7BCB6_BRACR|nr:hypothetical protein DY000_02038123 [Brassica cretica]
MVYSTSTSTLALVTGGFFNIDVIGFWLSLKRRSVDSGVGWLVGFPQSSGDLTSTGLASLWSGDVSKVPPS